MAAVVSPSGLIWLGIISISIRVGVNVGVGGEECVVCSSDVFQSAALLSFGHREAGQWNGGRKIRIDLNVFFCATEHYPNLIPLLCHPKPLA